MPALISGGEKLRAVLEQVVGTARPLLHWLYDNPCPDLELGNHFAAIVGGYVHTSGEMLSFLDGSTADTEDTVVTRVEAILADIKVHEAAIDRWEP